MLNIIGQIIEWLIKGGRAIGLTRLFWQGIMVEAGLMVLWIVVIAIRG
jgi:hypothetical protein